MGDPNISFFEVQSEFNAYWADRDQSVKGAGIKPYKRWEYFMETRVDENGFYDVQSDLKSYQKFLNGNSTQLKSSNGIEDWTILGPFGNPSGNNGVGRINVIKVNPDDSDNIFVGTPNGGLWESDNGGTSWITYTDDHAVLGVSDIAFDPADSDHMFIVTGDRDHNDTSTIGIMESTDGGLTWALTDFRPSFNGLPYFYLIHVLLIDPSDVDIMIASTTSGVFRTTDGWSTWTEVLPNDCLRDMKFHPTNSNIVYGTTSGAYCGGLNPTATYFRSTNNGASWTQITLPQTNIERVALGVSANNPSKVYFLASYDDPGNGNDFSGLFVSNNSGATVTQVSVNSAPSLGSQQWYDWTLTVNPSNANELYAGGVGFRKSTDGGVNWSSVSGIHVDHHYAGFEGSDLYVGSDGGIYRTSNGGSSWTFLNEGLEITQYYRISNAETNQSRMLAGSQDNGTHMLLNGNWSHEYGGDGMDNAIDPNDENNLFVSYQYGNFFRSTNGGSSFSSMIRPSDTGINGAWVTPIKIDETNTDILYTGYDRIWKSTNDGVSWSDVGGGKLTSGSGLLRYIDVSKSNNSVIYTTDYNDLWRSDNGGSTWSSLTTPDNAIRWIEIDPNDHLHVWLAADRDVYESTNGGSSWTNISYNLPNVPMNTIVFDDGFEDHLYIGTDFGIYYLDITTTTWTLISQSLPNVEILELDILDSGKKIRAATFGRGVWERLTVNATDNYSCDNAYPITMPGVYASQSPDQGGGAESTDATNSVWYTYESSHNGFLNIRSCNGGIDTRLHVYSGTCGNFTLLGTSDDDCTMGSGMPNNASELELIPVTANTPVYIEWDDRWSTECFDFEVEFIQGIVGYVESFEGDILYENVDTDDHDWWLIDGPTPSDFTGPTAASDGTHYVYVESSSPYYPSLEAILESNTLVLSGYSQPFLMYDYHMWGEHMNDFELQISENGGPWVSLITVSGDQGNAWLTESIDLTVYKDSYAKFRFIGTTGSNYKGDIAIDNIRFFEGGSPCNVSTLIVETSDITMDNMVFEDAEDIEVEADVNYNNITFRAALSVSLEPGFTLPVGNIMNLEIVPCP